MADLQILRGVSILAGLSDAELGVLAAGFHRRNFPARSIIFHQGEPGVSLYVMLAGKVRVALYSERKEMTVAIMGPGEVFGEMALLTNRPRSATVITMTDTQVLTLHRDDFHAGLRAYPEIAVNILAVLADRLRATTAFAAELVFKNLHGRVAQALLTLAERHGVAIGDEICIDVPLTQTELAHVVGTTRESVSRTLTTFEQHGVLRVDGATVFLRQRDVLRRAAARDSAMLDV